MLENLKKISERFNDVTNDHKSSKGWPNMIRGEIDEVENEIKDRNKIYLEDEIGDILWTTLGLITALEREGKVESLESIIKGAERKFSERVGKLENTEKGKLDEAWKKVKIFQKERMKKEHDYFYNK